MEKIIPDNPEPDCTTTLDIHVLALLGGRQRTRLEYRSLLDKAGFSFIRVIDTAAGISILEATPAESGPAARLAG